MTPIAILDLAPKFNIPLMQTHVYNEYMESISNKLSFNPEIIYIYNHEIIKKVSVEEDEECYSNILKAYNRLIQIINKSNSYDYIVVHMGRFSEYKYLFSMLRTELSVYHNIHRIYFRHPSYYIKDLDLKKREKMFNKDIKKIIYCINSLKWIGREIVSEYFRKLEKCLFKK